MQQPPNQEYPHTDELDNIPFEVQRVIDELVKLWQTHSVPPNLAMHIDKLPSTWGRHIVRNFFRQVYEDLRTDERNSYAAFSNALSIIRDGHPMKTYRRSNYAAFSASEFKRLLETEYTQWVQTHAAPQAWAKADAEAQAKAKERDEYVRKVRDEFVALGELMAKTTDRKERIELAQKREDLAQDLAKYTGFYYVYTNHCWNCQTPISSEINARCPGCKLFICNNCGACFCNRTNNPFHDEAVDLFLPDYPDDIS